MGQRGDSTAEFEPYKPTTKEFQYVNPVAHRRFLSCIVQADIPNLKSAVKSALAVSIRVDGSIDRFQRDNEFVMLKVVQADGSDSLFFLGFGEPDEGGALGKSIA